MNKLQYKLSCMICYITKSRAHFEFSTFFGFSSSQVIDCLCYHHHLCVLLFIYIAPSIYCCCGSGIRFVLYFCQIAVIVYNLLHQVIKVLWFFSCYCFIVALWRSIYVTIYYYCSSGICFIGYFYQITVIVYNLLCQVVRVTWFFFCHCFVVVLQCSVYVIVS